MMVQNEPDMMSYKRYIGSWGPIGIWCISLAGILILEFPTLAGIGFILILIAVIISVISILLQLRSNIKWKPLHWVDVNQDRKNHEKHYKSFVYQTVIAFGLFVIYFCIKLISWSHFFSDGLCSISFTLLLLSSIFLIYYSLKRDFFNLQPNTYFRYYEMDYNSLSEKFAQVIHDSDFSFYSEFHKGRWFIPQYTKYLIKEPDVEVYRNIHIYLTQDKIGSFITIHNIWEWEIERAEKLKKEIDKVID